MFVRVQNVTQIIFSRILELSVLFDYMSCNTVWDMERIYFRYKTAAGKIVMF
jgi:hypothetical protein